VLVNIARTAY